MANNTELLRLQPKEGYYDRNQTFTLCGAEYHYRLVLPRKARDWMAMDLAEKSLVFDEKLGVAYEGYSHEQALVFLMVHYYTDFDVEAYRTTEGWYALYDLFESYGVLDELFVQLDVDLNKVVQVYERIKEASIHSFETEHSLTYLIGRMFGSFLGDENIGESIAKAADMNNTMVKLLGAYNKLQLNPGAAGGGISFEKRNPRKR